MLPVDNFVRKLRRIETENKLNSVGPLKKGSIFDDMLVIARYDMVTRMPCVLKNQR